MFKFITFSFLAFVLAIFYLSLFNVDTVKIFITKERFYEVPKVGLIMISTAVGAFFILYVFLMRDTRRYFQTRSLIKKKKQEDRTEGFYSKATHCMVNKRTDEAIEEFNNALKENPSHIASLLKLGDIYAKKDDTENAGKYYQKVLAVDSKNLEALTRIVALRAATNKTDDALDTIERILEIEEDNLDALYEKRRMYERLMRWDDLITLQKTIITIASDKDKTEEQSLLPGYEYESGRQGLENNQIEKAMKTFRNVLKTDNSFVPAHLGRTEVMIIEGNTDEAISYLENAYEQTRSIILLIRLEDLLINIGQPGRLLSTYRIAIAANPGDERLKFFMGKVYYRLEMLDEALDILNTLDPSVFYPVIHQLRSGIYLKRNQCEKAVEEFQKIISLKEAMVIPYCCNNCGYEDPSWNGRCPSCKQWNTYGFFFQK